MSYIDYVVTHKKAFFNFSKMSSDSFFLSCVSSLSFDYGGGACLLTGSSTFANS